MLAIQSKILQPVRVGVPTDIFPFRGTPDFLFHKKNVAVMVDSSSEDEDVESEISSAESDVAVEFAHQRYPLKAKQLPNKCGELIAALHFILASKLLRKLKQGKNLSKTYYTTGALLDKIVGVVKITLSGKWSSSEQCAKFEIASVQSDCRTLNPSMLCTFLNRVCV